MRLTFLGASGTVTGSKYLVEADGKKLLVDCGLFQGPRELRAYNRSKLPFDPKEMDAVILTHAHLDHSGMIPVLTRSGYRGPIYSTQGTLDLCKVLLPDSGKLQEEEAEYAAKKGYSKHQRPIPLYTQEDAEASLRNFAATDWESPVSLTPRLKVTFSRAGHIIGASFVTIENAGMRVVFSGDLGRFNDPVLRAPDPIRQADFVVVESTYGGRKHPAVNFLEELKQALLPALKRGGVVVVPAFSVGRTQTLLHCLEVLKRDGQFPDVPVFLNSPMSVNATGIFCSHLKEHKLSPDECRRACEVAKYVRTPQESKALNERSGPMIIISASGMATGGRVLHHLKAFGPDEKNLILLTGFQAAGTRGEALVHGKKEIKIHGQMIPIRAEVKNLEAFSAHADGEEILKWLSGMSAPPKKVFITHGEPQASFALKETIEKQLSWSCHVPRMGESVTLE